MNTPYPTRPASASRVPCSIEILEARIAPAVLIAASGHSASYTDVDGDHVTVKVTGFATGSGVFTPGLFTTVASGVGEQLQKLDFGAGGFDGANITFAVAKVPGGDGLANVGYVNSTGHDLGKVIVKGDLGQIDAGDATTATPGLKALSVRSLGRLGTDTQAGGGDLKSNISGALGPLMVAGDVKDAYVDVSGGADGKIGAITIGGSLIGGSNQSSGSISSSGDMGAVKIGRDLKGGSGFLSAYIVSSAKLASVSISGSLIGGSNPGSGAIHSAGDMGAVKIGHDMKGGSGIGSAQIFSSAKLAGVSIGGSLIGGSNTGSGEVFSTGDMGAVKIGHDLIGGSITGSASLSSSGEIETLSGRITSVTIGGSIISGTDASSGALTKNATIRAAKDIGSLTVKGSLIGNVTAEGASPVIISASGQAALPGAKTDLAIGRVSIGGSVEFTNILAGYDRWLSALNGDAQIGAVTVGGDWVAGNLVAGAKNAASGNTKFGDINDASIGAGSASIIAKIASITIGGQLFGTPNSVSNTDHFGFVAEQIGAVKIGGSAIALTAGAHNDNRFAGHTTDVNIHEI